MLRSSCRRSCRRTILCSLVGSPCSLVRYVRLQDGYRCASPEEGWAASKALDILDADLSCVLRQKYNVFWSHVLYDARLLRAVDLFLRYARRAFDSANGRPPLDPKSVLFSVFVKIFKGEAPFIHGQMGGHSLRLQHAVLLRMSTNREAATDFMDAHYYADVVYNKWIFDIPKIFDICTLYGSFNAKVSSISHTYVLWSDHDCRLVHRRLDSW